MEISTISVLVKWIHLIAAAAWIGGMFTNLFIYLPVIRKTLDPPTTGKLMGAVMKRFRIMVYFMISIFIVSGIAMVALRGQTSGPLRVGDSWFLYFFGKMLLFAILVFLAVYAFEILAPRAAKLAGEGSSPRLQRLQKRQGFLAMAGFILGIIILLVSASL
jgi:uncharacterized membrane protein